MDNCGSVGNHGCACHSSVISTKFAYQDEGKKSITFHLFPRQMQSIGLTGTWIWPPADISTQLN